MKDAADGGWFVGTANPFGPSPSQLRWHDGTVERTGNGVANAVNSHGTAVSGITVTKSDGSVRTLPVPSDLISAFATGINDHGDVIGHADDHGRSAALLWEAHGDRQVIQPPAGYDWLSGISVDNHGRTLVKAAHTPNAGNGDYFIRSRYGTYTMVDTPAPGAAIDGLRLRNGLIVGRSSLTSGDNWAPTVWNLSGKVVQRFTGDSANRMPTDPVSVDSRGRVVAPWLVDGKARISLWDHGTQTILGTEFDGTVPVAITNDGVIAAQAFTGSTVHAVEYRHTCH